MKRLLCNRNVTFITPSYVKVEQIGSKYFFFNLKTGKYLSLPSYVYNLVKNGLTETTDYTHKKYLQQITYLMIKAGYIEPDISKLEVFPSFFDSRQNKMKITERLAFDEIFVSNNINDLQKLLRTKGYLNPKSKFNLIIDTDTKLSKDLNVNGKIYTQNYKRLDEIFSTVTLSNDLEICIVSSEIPSDKDIIKLKFLMQKFKVRIIFSYGQSNVNEISKKLLDLTKKGLILSFDICNPYFINYENEIIVNSNFNKIDHYCLKSLRLSCGAGKNKFYIDENGWIYSCYKLRNQKSLGNVQRDNIFTILQSMKTDKSNLKCTHCPVYLFCGGGCKADYDKGEYKYCEHIKDYLIKCLKNK